MIIRAIIVDDEQNNIDNLLLMLQKYCPAIEIAGVASSAADARRLIETLRPDALFLDIQMPRESGFDLLTSLEKPLPEVVFVTAFDQYGVRAIKFSALDYLLKPVNPGELVAAVDKLKDRVLGKSGSHNIENLIQMLRKKDERSEHRIALATLKETRYVETRHILCCVSTNNYTQFYLDDDTRILVSKPIYEYEELLKPYGFIRCHQSWLVNKKHVTSWIKEDGGYLLVNHNIQVPVSRSKKDFVAAMLQQN